MEEDVIGFEVAMHDVAFVEDFEGLEELLEEEQCAFLLNEAVLAHHSL
jgi:hypothetical protein